MYYVGLVSRNTGYVWTIWTIGHVTIIFNFFQIAYSLFLLFTWFRTAAAWGWFGFALGLSGVDSTQWLFLGAFRCHKLKFHFASTIAIGSNFRNLKV